MQNSRPRVYQFSKIIWNSIHAGQLGKSCSEQIVYCGFLIFDIEPWTATLTLDQRTRFMCVTLCLIMLVNTANLKINPSLTVMDWKTILNFLYLSLNCVVRTKGPGSWEHHPTSYHFCKVVYKSIHCGHNHNTAIFQMSYNNIVNGASRQPQQSCVRYKGGSLLPAWLSSLRELFRWLFTSMAVVDTPFTSLTCNTHR